ncbi:type II secretion system F family protein [Stenotrophomonas maltophilia]|uniref:type II secretion system F family protein n=1 Tax=Stenotrophomonas maltophilia TaxID=40324 RepID=UPI0021C961F0|nr:type II secretion system F family protein [Stenotrophomonas maltophilia]MCU1136912.1 type II secretion system F family protein [Stenotrophomonas maltophilia]
MKLVKRKQGRRRLSKFEKWNVRRSFSVKRRCAFYSDMASFTSEGITPFHAMQRMLQVSKPRRSLRWLVSVLEPAVKSMEGGSLSLAAAISPWVPPQESAMLDAAERSAQLTEALTELAELLKVQSQVSGALISNLAPALGKLFVMILLMVYILNTVMKEAAGLIAPEVFDKLTLAPIYFAFGRGFLKSLPFLIVIAIVGSMVVSISLAKWKPSKVRIWLDRHLPPYTLAARVQSSFFLISAASMMESGATFKQAVSQIRANSNTWTKAHLTRVLGRMTDGLSEARSLQTGLLPWDVEDRLSVYELLDDFKRIMKVTARDSMQMLLNKVKLIGYVLNGAATVMLGTFIIFTIFSIGEVALETQSSINQIQRAN